MAGLLSFLRRLRKSPASAKRASRRERLAKPESLEPRVVLFAATGNAWANPQLVTISFMPDGTDLGGQLSNLNSAFNAKPALNGQWQTQILKAAQVWAQQTNLNFAVVTDNGAPSGSGDYQQGDPGFGDIRIGGYVFGNSNLARAYAPPPINNYSIAGDIAFNTSIGFKIGSTYDLFTVATHEFGHALGLEHTTATSAAQMYSAYNSAKSALHADDIAGIKSIYSGTAARSKDAYDAVAANSTVATATNVTSLINATTKTAVLNNLDITTTADIDYFKFTAPAGSSSTLKVTVQSSGLSLLAPKAWVYNASQSQLATVTGTGYQGSTLTMTVNGIVAGQTYYLKVDGADATAFGTGRYAVTLNMGSGANPTVTKPNTQVAEGTPLSGSGGVAQGSGEHDELLSVVPVITAISTDTGVSSADRTTSDRTLVISGDAPELFPVTVFRNGVLVGVTISNDHNHWSLDLSGTSLSDGTYTFTASATDLLGTLSPLSATFTVTIDTVAPNAPAISGFSPDSGVVGDSTTNVKRPTLLGTAAAGSRIEIFCDGDSKGTTTTDGYGQWSYALTGDLHDGAHNFTATATDLAGNVSNPSNTLRITVDTDAPDKPVVLGISPDSGVSGDEVTNSRNLVIYGTAEDQSNVTVFVNGMSVGTTVANKHGDWTFDYSGTTLAAGTYEVRATATDAASNVSDLASDLDVTVDLTLPTAPVLTAISVDTGASDKDEVTSEQHLVISGTTIDNGQLELFRNGMSVATTTAAGDGKWSIDLRGAPLAEGTHVFTARVTNDVANTSSLSANFNVVVDSTAPNAPVISGFSPDSGVVGDSTTNVKRPTLLGTAAAGSRIEIFCDGDSEGTTTTDGYGQWSYALTGDLHDGAHNFTATATDLAGNVSNPSNTLRITVDTDAPDKPVVLGISPDSGVSDDEVTNSRNLIIYGTAEDQSNVTVFVNGVSIGTTVANNHGDWTFDYSGTTLAAGTYEVRATATDAASNVSDLSSAFALTVSNVLPPPPVITTISPDTGASNTDEVTSSNALVVSGTTIGDVQVQLTCDGVVVGSTTAAGDGKWSVNLTTLPLSQCSHVFTAEVWNASGIPSNPSAEFNVTIDSAAPNAPVVQSITPDTNINGDGITTSKRPTLFGTAEPNSSVAIYRDGSLKATVTADGNGQWSYTSDLGDGTYGFTAKATDLAGNVSAVSSVFQVIVDTKAPAKPIIGGVEKVGTTSLVVHGVAEANNTVQVKLNGAVVGTATADAAGSWNYTHNSAANGTYNFASVATDVAGNVGDVSATFTLFIGTGAAISSTPVLSAASDTGTKNDGITATRKPILTGTATAGSKVTILDGNTVLGTVTAKSNGTWTFTCPTLSLGNHNFSTFATDSLGRRGLMSGVLAIKIQTNIV